jgi:hypothetical protein
MENLNWASASSISYVMNTSSSTAFMPPSPPPARPQSPLEWLDAEIESTCAIARRTG